MSNAKKYLSKSSLGKSEWGKKHIRLVQFGSILMVKGFSALLSKDI